MYQGIMIYSSLGLLAEDNHNRPKRLENPQHCSIQRKRKYALYCLPSLSTEEIINISIISNTQNWSYVTPLRILLKV